MDLEAHKHRDYPDVLIGILKDLLAELRPKSSWYDLWGPQRRARRQCGRLLKRLNDIEARAPETNYTIDKSDSSRRGHQVNAGASRWQLFAFWRHERRRAADVRSSGTYAKTKIQELRDLVPELQGLLRTLVDHTPATSCLIFLDDFYFIARGDQPPVLDFLHGSAKGTGTWLKVGGVGRRLNAYEEGDPPVGLKEDEDAHKLELDLTLENFNTAKDFLEEVLRGILEPIGVAPSELITDEGRNRLVIACGGAVSRDYLTLILAALDVALEHRAKRNAAGADLRLSAEDIQKAASTRSRRKEEADFEADAGEDAPALRARWRDVRDFVKTRPGDESPFFLVRVDEMSETRWGRELASLESLRLIHRIGYQTPNTDSWRGINCVVFMIDYGFVAVQRLTSAKYWDFWKGQREMDRLRRAGWVYTLDWREKAQAAQVSDGSAPLATKEDQLSLLDGRDDEST